MRVLQVIARLNVGGTARYVGRLATDLPAHAVETLVASGCVQGAEVEDPVAQQLVIKRIAHLGRRINPIADLKALRELQQAVDAYRPDVIHTHTFKAGLLGRLVKSDAKRVHTFHGHLLDDPEFSRLKRNFVIRTERWLAPRADALVTVGQRVGRDLLAAKIGRPDQYLSIPPGVDPLPLPSRHEARLALGIDNEDRPIVAWVARVTGVKAPHRVVELARLLPSARFVMAGGGDLLEEMRRSAPDNLTILGWQDAATVWGAADITLSTSDNEGMPVALIEAQLAGLPVVATDVGGVSEVVEDQITGFVTATDVESLRVCLAELIQDAGLCERMGQAAKIRASELFTPEKMVAAHIGLYERLINEPKHQ
jgi:glycosyltransferase involved in cell wall biosynthesis